MNSTKEEVEEIRAQLPEEWKYLVDLSPDMEWVKDTYIFDKNGKLDLKGILGYIDQVMWFSHIGF